jgi:hypothetical protein
VQAPPELPDQELPVIEGRVLVRRKPVGLTAYPVRRPGSIELADGSTVHAAVGAIAITRGASTLAVLTPAQFAADYEVVVEGALMLSPADCGRIEETTGIGTAHSTPDLVAAIGRLAAMRIGDIRIPFTPGQLSELQHRAAKRGRTVEAEMRAVVDRIQDELFYKGG